MSMCWAAADAIKGNRSSRSGNFCSLLVLTQAILLFSACAAFQGYPDRATDPSSDLLQLQPDIQADQITACLAQTENSSQLACRNRIVAARLYAIDIQFSEFEEGFAATLATLGLTSAAAIAGGTASQILSGAAAFIIGSREAFQKEVLAERTLIAIHTAMRAGRTQALIRIRAGLSQPVDQYPLAMGLADLNAYYDAGTVLGALVGITESVGAEAQRAQQQLQEQIRFNLDPAASRLERAICRDYPACEDIDDTKFAEIRACWSQLGIPADRNMLDFVLQPVFQSERERVATCMGL
jgi:hypothetical protein